MTSTEYVLDNNNQLVVVYLSRFGCLNYTETILKGLQHMDPFIICCQENVDYFSAYNTFPIDTPKSKLSMATQSLSIARKVNQLMGSIKTSKPLELLIPAFHPWNHFFINWANKNDTESSLVVHDFYTHKGEFSVLIEALQKKAMASADRIIFLSNFVKEQAIAACGTIPISAVIPHPTIEAGATNNLPYNPKPNLLFMGRVKEYKGINLLISAIQDLPINKLTIAGEQTGLAIEDSPKLNIIDKYLTEAEIAALLASHEILVLPYLEATQSGILTLGISARMVMLVSAVGGLPEQLNEDKAVWVKPTIQSIREGLINLISNQEMYSKVKTNISKLSGQ